MAQAKRDENRVTTLIAVLSTDGLTPMVIKADPTTHILKTSNGTTGSDNGRGIAARDENRIPVLMAVSSADGITPIEVYADSSGNLLVTNS